jgi:plastocyanin
MRTPRRTPTRILAAALTTLGLAVSVGSASADERIIAGPLPSSYLTPTVSAAAGEAVTFVNIDLTANHDVTSAGRRGDGSPLFSSETVGAGTEVPVRGLAGLAGGSYPFICSIHPFMQGTLVLSGGGGGGGDRKPPMLTLAILDGDIDRVLRSGKLRTRVAVDEPARTGLRATAGRNKLIGTGQARLARKGARTVAITLNAAGKRMLRGARSLRVRVTGSATDAAGNTRRRSSSRTLR